MIVFKKALICYGILLVIFHFSLSVSGSELVGIFPFSNQRYQKQNDWIGFYIQARIKANLCNNSDWQFHSQNVLNLWALRLDRSLPISPQTTILIEGSFQQVAELGYVSLRINRYNSEKGSAVNFEQTFSKTLLDTHIDELSLRIGRWIQSDFSLKQTATFPHQGMQAKKEVFSMRQKMFEPGKPPDVRMILYLEELVNTNSPFELICDLGESMMIMSQMLERREQKIVLGKIETLLRKAILKNRKRSRLYSLLAEVYYLNDNYASWIEKTADDAIRFDAQNDLGYILKLIINDSDADMRKKDMESLHQVNPWLFSESLDGGALYQKGILKEEISRIINPLN